MLPAVPDDLTSTVGVVALAAGGVAIIALLSCDTHTHDAAQRDSASSAAASKEPVQNKVDTRHLQQMVARAERSLAQSLPLDYRRPFSSSDPERPATVSLYLEACRAGDNPSCWIARELGAFEATKIIRANCVAGDIMSCRAILRNEDIAPEASGGRTVLCAEDSKHCGIEDLRRECLAGFPLSCWRIREVPVEELPDRDALAARVAPLARAGCQARIDDECSSTFNTYTEAETRLIAERMCPLVVRWCAILSKYYKKEGDLVRARDLAEQSCQYGNDILRCRQLGTAYVTGEFPEPVPGRGEALLTWGCRSDVAKERDDVCKARAAKQHGRPRPEPAPGARSYE